MLNELGITQAKKLGEIVKDIKFDQIFTSDLKRAIDSSNIAFPNNSKITDKRLRECNYGQLDGMDKKLVVYEDHITEPFLNGESLKDVELRVKDFINYLKKNYDGKTIGVVAHRAPQLALEVLLNGKTWEDAIKNDWRKTGDWKPGWQYIIK